VQDRGAAGGISAQTSAIAGEDRAQRQEILVVGAPPAAAVELRQPRVEYRLPPEPHVGAHESERLDDPALRIASGEDLPSY